MLSEYHCKYLKNILNEKNLKLSDFLYDDIAVFNLLEVWIFLYFINIQLLLLVVRNPKREKVLQSRNSLKDRFISYLLPYIVFYNKRSTLFDMRRPSGLNMLVS